MLETASIIKLKYQESILAGAINQIKLLIKR